MTIVLDPLEIIVLTIIFCIPIVLLIVQGNQLDRAQKEVKVMRAMITLLTNPNTLLNDPRWKELPRNDE